MKKFLFILLALFLFPVFTFASGKMLVGENETVILEAESHLSNPEYKWALLQNNAIVDTQTGSSYSHLFPKAGSFTLNLTVSSPVSKDIENSQIDILVGTSAQFSDSLNIGLETFPAIISENIIALPENNLTLGFILTSSKGDIKEYHIDSNTAVDSDGDGDPANDIDNLNDASLYTGALWTTSYKKENLPAQAKVTVLAKDETKMEQFVRIQSVSATASSKLKAVIETSPASAGDKQIHLQGDTATMYIFTGSSEGKILEYRLDTNIKVDSDGDLNPANDIDNLTDTSFHSGGIFTLPLSRASGDVIVQLTVVGVGGKGSLVQKKIVWDSSSDLVKQGIFRVYADNSTPHAGETVHFGLDGLIPGEVYNIKWDFNGDKTTDLEKTDGIAIYTYDAIGNYSVLVQIKNENAKLLKYATFPIQVQAKSKDAPVTRAPISNFSYTQDANKLMFTNTSSSDETLINKVKIFAWDFGDKLTSKEENPTHVYKEKGNYIVRLKIMDSSGQSHEKQMLIEVKNINPKYQVSTSTEIKTPVKTETNKKPVKAPEKINVTGSSTAPFFSIGVILFMMIMLFGGGVLIYLFIQKIRHPDYSFGEIIEEEKEKMLSILEGRPYEAPSGEILNTGKEVKEDIQGILKESEAADKIKKDLKTENIPDASVDTKIVATTTQPPLSDAMAETHESPLPSSANEETTPQWMQDLPAVDNASTPTENIISEETPDWMKEMPQDSSIADEVQNSTPETASLTNTTPVPPPPPVPPLPQNIPDTNAQAPATTDDDDIPDWLK